MKRNRIVGTIAALVIGAGTIGTIAAEAGSASAKPLHTETAVTKIVNRDDNGGGGMWARDSFTRTVKLVFLGKSHDPLHATEPYMYYGVMNDTNGTFRDLPGALTPNQGGHFAGRHLPFTQINGVMSGTAAFPLFYASAKAHAGLVPSVLKGHTLNAAYPSYLWPENFFAPGTTFVGAGNESPYDYNYHAKPVFNAKHKIIRYKLNWEDASWNADGQLRADGNI